MANHRFTTAELDRYEQRVGAWPCQVVAVVKITADYIRGVVSAKGEYTFGGEPCEANSQVSLLMWKHRNGEARRALIEGVEAKVAQQTRMSK